MPQFVELDEAAILGRLPTYLRHECLMAIHHNTFQSIPLFRYIENQSVMLYIWKLMDPSYYDKGNYIIKEGDFSLGISFLVFGSAEVSMWK